MSTGEKEKLMMAYLDGQMSATEASAFDDTLTPEERDFMAAEMRIETGLAEALGGDAACPDALWRRTQLCMRNQNTQPRRQRTALRGWLAAAAALVIAAGLYFVFSPKEDQRLFAMVEASVDELATTADVPAEDAALRDFLKAHGLDIAFEAFSDVHPESPHLAALLGARVRTYNDEPTVELLYNCCGRPARIVLAKEGTASAKQLEQAMNVKTVQRVGKVRGHVAGVISDHCRRVDGHHP